MDPTQSLVAFDLRFRELELPAAAADVADFARPLAGLARAGDGLDLDDEGMDRLLLESAALAEGMVPLPQAPEARMIPLFDADVRPIPIPEPALVDAPADAPATAAWALESRRPALVAAVPRRADRRRCVVVAAVSLPLLLLASPASAGEPEVQRPTTAEPAPKPAREATPPLEPMPATVEAPPQPEALPMPEAPPQVEAPQTLAEGATPSVGVSEAHWQAMRGEEVKLMLPQGPRQGRLVAVDGPEVIFVDYEGDGRLYSVPKAQVMELRGVVKQAFAAGRERPYGVPDPTLPTGNGLIAGGSVATAIGGPFFLSAVVITGLCPSCVSLTLPLFLPGIIGLGAGIPMLVKGVRRKRAWRQSAIASRLRPSFGGARQGWTGSLTFRF
ncbi:MAG: hypothetical protein R3A79_04910 [Nannocystaceae bacterium]